MAANHGIPRPEPNRDTPEPNRDTPEPNRDTLLSQSRHWSSARVELRERLSLATALGRAKGSSTWALGVYREQHFGRTFCAHARASSTQNWRDWRGVFHGLPPLPAISGRLSDWGGVMVATALLAAFPFLPFALPKRVQSIGGIWVMAACSLSGLAFGFWP
jgi:hypothetical protein